MTNTEHPQASSTGNVAAENLTAVEQGRLAGTIIGLDIGGTKTHGVRFEDGIAVADESAGSSNVQNVSREDAA